MNFKNVYKTIGSVIALPIGLVLYWLTGKTINKSYQSLIWAFCITSGRSNDWISRVIQLFSNSNSLKNKNGILGNFDDEKKLEKIVNEIKENGYIVFPRALSEEAIANLKTFTLETEATIRIMDGQEGATNLGKIIYSGGKPAAVRYDYEAEDLLNQIDVQNLLADGSLLAIAEKYLNAKPLADVLSMWWHTNFSDKPDSIAAQYYHFDMDRIKWLKVFIYLTDVGPDNGPHSFIKGSHKTLGIPKKMLSEGYVRIEDEEIKKYYSSNDLINFVGEKGTIIIEDTRGLHKGAHVTGDSRLILQLQFSNSLFGTSYKKSKINKIISNNLMKSIEFNRGVYRDYI